MNFLDNNGFGATPPPSPTASVSPNEPPHLIRKRKAPRQFSPAQTAHMQAAFQKMQNTTFNDNNNDDLLFLRTSEVRLRTDAQNVGITPVQPIRNHSNKRPKLNEGNE